MAETVAVVPLHSTSHCVSLPPAVQPMVALFSVTMLAVTPVGAAQVGCGVPEAWKVAVRARLPVTVVV